MKPAGAAAVLAVCSACVIGPGAGGGGGGEADAGTQTVGDQCTAIVTEFCTQAIGRCAMAGFTLADCIASDMPMCCTGTACSGASLSPPSAVTACKNAIDIEDCNFIANSTLPGACQGVPRKS